jgi:hypothetical protein
MLDSDVEVLESRDDRRRSGLEIGRNVTIL